MSNVPSMNFSLIFLTSILSLSYASEGSRFSFSNSSIIFFAKTELINTGWSYIFPLANLSNKSSSSILVKFAHLRSLIISIQSLSLSSNPRVYSWRKHLMRTYFSKSILEFRLSTSMLNARIMRFMMSSNRSWVQSENSSKHAKDISWLVWTPFRLSCSLYISALAASASFSEVLNRFLWILLISFWSSCT